VIAYLSGSRRKRSWNSIDGWFTALLLAGLLLTNRYLSLGRDAAWVEFAGGDAYTYLAIADAFPSLPRDVSLWLHKAQRLFFPYVLGGVAWTFGVSTEHVFRVFGLLVVLAVVLVFRRMLLSLALSVEVRMVLLSLLILNAYMFRYHIAIPWMVSDLGFELGLSMALLGLLRERPALTYAGLLVATLGKQTAIALIPGVIAWMWFVWNAPRRVKIAQCLAAAVLGPIVFVATTWLVASFSRSSDMAAHVIGLFQWMSTQFSPSTLAAFAARGLIVFALPMALFVSLAVTRKLPVRWYRNIRLWLCLGLAAPIEMEPVLAGPAVTGGSMTRLAVLAYLPVLLGLATVLEQIPLPAAVQRRLVFVSAFTAAIGSFHHFYSFLGIPDPQRAGAFAAVYLMSAAMLCVGAVVSQQIDVG
jgi:hypothetical protein